MKSISSIYIFIIHLNFCLIGQKLNTEFIINIPIASGWVSSENILSISPENDKLFATAILSVNPNSKTSEYLTKVYFSSDGGMSWQNQKIPFLPKAADPWISFTSKKELLLADISEGNKFHLNSTYYNGKKWSQPISHGLGHDHSMILVDRKRELTYLISTIQNENKKELYIAVSNDHGKSFLNNYKHEIFRGVDFNAKQVVINDQGDLLIPVVVRGVLKSEGKVESFNQMNSWLFSSSDQGESMSQPIFITNKAGRKHHILVKGNRKDLFFIYTNAERSFLEIIKSENGGTNWNQTIQINDSQNQKFVNLDAALYSNNNIFIVWTSEKETGTYQKYISVINASSLKVLHNIPIGKISKPTKMNGWVVRAWPQGGDYCGLVTDKRGNIYIQWSAAENGLFKPKFSKINLK